MTSFNLNHLLKSPTPNTATLSVKTSKYELPILFSEYLINNIIGIKIFNKENQAQMIYQIIKKQIIGVMFKVFPRRK